MANLDHVNEDGSIKPYVKPVKLSEAQRQAARVARWNERQRVNHGGTAKARTNGSNSPDLALPKGKTRDEQKAEQHAAEVKQIAKTRRKLWKLTSTCCACGDSEDITAQKCAVPQHQMHEDPPRSLTRGLPPEERFNIYVCGRICPLCHPKATEHVIRFNFHDSIKRFRGDYDVIDVASGHIVAHMRRDYAHRIVTNPLEDL